MLLNGAVPLPIRWLFVWLLSGCAVALAAECPTRLFNVPAGSASETLKRFAAQADREIMFPAEPLAGIRTKALKGRFTPSDALKRLLANTTLRAVEDAKTGAFVVIRTVPPGASPAQAPPSSDPPPSGKISQSMKRKTPLALMASWLALALAPVPTSAVETVPAHAATGTITGIVTNKNTGNGLEGALISVPKYGLTTFVDNTGRYVLSGVPEGVHEITAAYTGLDTARASVTVNAGQPTTNDFILTSEIYTLEVFRVSGEREGNSAAIVAQRNADNVKNVVSMDAYGNLPNLNATELALRLPGVTFAGPGDEVVETISIRGMGVGSNTITIDGGLMSSFSAVNRQTRMTAFTGAMFESFEIIKGHTPDKGADSLGGTMNLRSRSPLSMRDKRRIAYTLSVSTAPSFTEQVPIRREHPTHPLVNATYQEKFSIFGSKTDNFAVAVNVFYSENAFGFYQTVRDFQQTNTSPAYLWDYRTKDNFNNRKQTSYTTKFDYRLSPNSKITLNLIYNDAPEPARRQYQHRAFAGSATTVPNATTSGVVPGWTDRVTTVRAVPTASNATSSTTPAAAIDMTTYLICREQRLRHADIAGEHKFNRLELDWAAVCSRTRYVMLGDEGTLNMRIGGVPFVGPKGGPGSATNNIVGPNGQTGVGWILDRTQDDLYPKFTQNGGLDFTDPRNYRPSVNGLTANAGEHRTHSVYDLRGNAKYLLPIEWATIFLKTGGDYRKQTVWNLQNVRRWSYLGTDPLPARNNIVMWDKLKTGRDLPVWEVTDFLREGQPINRSLWQEDVYYHESTLFINYYDIREEVLAGYLMAQGKIGGFGFVTGVRAEKTDNEVISYVKSRVGSTAAQQAADPVGAARADYEGNLRNKTGGYTKYFPSVHLNRNLRPNLKTRASWSTSFGRPSMLDMRATETVNETAQTLTVGNPSLFPQTASTWDLSLEYYYEPSGSISVNWFHKTIKDYIVTGQVDGVIGAGTDNGYGGQYSGFTKLTARNMGTAISSGWELSYLQQFRFLPGVFKGLSLNANTTIIDTHGNYGGNQYRTRDEVVGFIPRTGNLSLSWNYRKIGTRILYNYTAGHIRSYNSTQPSRNIYMKKRELVNLGLTYRVRPNLTLQVDIANLFNEPQQYYIGIPSQMQQFLIQGTKITIGLQGQL
ncbi:MAG: TonB-dependent receptor [Opitutae bacterium]|nr:TonB-dependent receptor [Opitutae bacterium]